MSHDTRARAALETFRARHQAWLREAFWSGFFAGALVTLTLFVLFLWSHR